MPYARVGAMPQPDHNNHGLQQGAGGHKGRSQGITMEDLKRQTAIRLAQEQQQQQQTGFEQQPQQQSSGRMHILPSEHVHTTMHHQPSYSGRQHAVPVEVKRSAGVQAMIDHANRNRTRQPPKQQFKSVSRSTTAAPSQQQVADWTQRIPKSSRPGSSSSRSSSSFDSTSPDITTQQSRRANAKAKLPHGLTVQELKEMTKARLQAESTDDVTTTFSRDARDASSPVGIVQDSYVAREAIPAYAPPQKPAGMPVGFQGRVSPHHSTTVVSSVVRYDATMQHSSSQGVIHVRDSSWQQQTSGLDGWETTSVASVNSTVNSEYLGSESAYSAGFGGISGQQQQEEMPGVPFNRSRSYGGAFEQHSTESLNRSVATGSPYSDFVDGDNRRRAFTLSPRPGSSLSHLHEDRPLGAAASTMGIPSFDSSGRSFPRVRTESADPPFREAASLTSSPSRPWAGQNGGVIGGGLFNRPRTASAPSIRPVSQPSGEFMSQKDTPLARLSSSHSLGVTVGSSGDRSSMIGIPSGSLENDAYASVFRNTTNVADGSPRPPPGLFLPTDDMSGSLFAKSPSHEFGSDDAWNKPSQQPPQTNELQLGSMEDSLADNLGSILKLSGARESDSLTEQDTLVSRIDPQVDFNQSTAAAQSPVSSRFSTISPGSHGGRDSFSMTDNPFS